MTWLLPCKFTVYLVMERESKGIFFSSQIWLQCREKWRLTPPPFLQWCCYWDGSGVCAGSRTTTPAASSATRARRPSSRRRRGRKKRVAAGPGGEQAPSCCSVPRTPSPMMGWWSAPPACPGRAGRSQGGRPSPLPGQKKRARPLATTL